MHLPKEELEAFETNTLNTQDMIAFLEHLDTCDFCLEQLLREERANCIQAPAYIKNQIMKKAVSPEIQASRAAAAASGRMRLFYHGLQTAFGVITALFLLFCSGNIDLPARLHDSPVPIERVQEPETPKHRNQLYDFAQGIGMEISKGTDTFTKYLNQISNKVLNGGK